MGIKISELPGADTPFTGNELIEIVQDGISRQGTAQNIADLASIITGPSVIVLNIHTSEVGNSGTSETVLDEHVLQAGILANDGQGLSGEFFGKIDGGDLTSEKIRLRVINNGIDTIVFDTEFVNYGFTVGLAMFFSIVRIDANTIKVSAWTPLKTVSDSHNTYTNIGLLDLSLGLTIQLTGTSSSTGHTIFGEFSKIFFTPVV